MGRYELDKWTVSNLYELWKKGRLNTQPDWQRSEVWPDRMKYDLVDTVANDWPMGLVMINVVEHVDEDLGTREYYEVVDGQQRVSTLFAYKDGQTDWSKKPPKASDFEPYSQLAPAPQERFDEYKVAVALMRGYEQDEILDVYSRLQNSKPLKIGEKVKALRTEFKPYIRELTHHKLFTIAGKAHMVRDAHWNLASVFFKSCYRDNALDRQEYAHLEEFLRNEKVNETKAKQSQATTQKIMNTERKVLDEAVDLDPSFESSLSSARLLKWLFVSLYLLNGRYALSGREHLIAKGVVSYYQAKEVEGSDEWIAYVNTGRTGRIDTEDVKASLEQMMNRIIVATGADPLDPNRFFTAQQRAEIFEKSKGHCAGCEIELSPTNFHADHIVPHMHGGATKVENGQSLCTACNRKKGGNPELFGK